MIRQPAGQAVSPVATPADDQPPELFDALADILADALVASYLRDHGGDRPEKHPGEALPT